MSPGDRTSLARCAVLIPVKRFSEAKSRLASVLSAEEREALARMMATRVLRAAGAMPVSVVCSDVSVAAWAQLHGARVIADPGGGLDTAVTYGVQSLAAHGATRVIIAHADLPLARDLTAFALDDPMAVVIAPDRHGTGTNVLSVPIPSLFRFQYGPDSFGRHQTEAARLGLRLVLVRNPELGTDVDTPEDLSMIAPEALHEHS